jgi:hypothetical protein
MTEDYHSISEFTRVTVSYVKFEVSLWGKCIPNDSMMYLGSLERKWYLFSCDSCGY